MANITYRWQVSTNGGSNWGNSGAAGYATAGIQLELTETRIGQMYRCKITDSYGNVVYSDPCSINFASDTWEFTYNADGLRTSRTDGYTTYNYVYNGGQLSQMTVGDEVLRFGYDANGAPLYVIWNVSKYFFTTNLQGDVVAIVSANGNPVVEYTYDAWGNILSITGSRADNLGKYNPLRYRGYVYDVETELYYLQSRYYDPEWGRFLNADAFVSTGQGLLGNNMFAYCNNNPVNAIDPGGYAFMYISLRDDSIFNMFFAGVGGGGCGYACEGLSSAKDGIRKIKDFLTNDSETVAKTNLKEHGLAFYKGVPVIRVDIMGNGALSFGVILMGGENLKRVDFDKTLNHEYGHTVHLRQVGVETYFKQVAIPSFVCAVMACIDPDIKSIYYNFPTERIADALGGVNRGYLPGADSLGATYWLFTVALALVD